MDMQTISWVVPLLLIPGIGQLLNATSARYGQFQNELHRTLTDDDHEGMHTVATLQRRALYFRNALVALHLSALWFALAGLLGALAVVIQGDALLVVLILTTIGILLLIGATIELVRETFMAQAGVQDHLAKILERDQVPS